MWQDNVGFHESAPRTVTDWAQVLSLTVATKSAPLFLVKTSLLSQAAVNPLPPHQIFREVVVVLGEEEGEAIKPRIHAYFSLKNHFKDLTWAVSALV